MTWKKYQVNLLDSDLLLVSYRSLAVGVIPVLFSMQINFNELTHKISG